MRSAICPHLFKLAVVSFYAQTPSTKAIETGMLLSIMDMKKTLLCIFFHRPIFTEIREFATIVLWKLAVNFGLGRFFINQFSKIPKLEKVGVTPFKTKISSWFLSMIAKTHGFES